MSQFHHLLVPIDASACAARALDQAIALAAPTGARITLLHVLEEWGYVHSFESAMNALNEIRPLIRAAGEQLLSSAGQKASALGVAADVVLWMPTQRERNVRLWEVVNDQARLCGADLIVIGSHGRLGPSRALLGSDAEQVIRHAFLPVLVVKGATPLVD